MNLNLFKKSATAPDLCPVDSLPPPQAMDAAVLPALLLVEQSAYSHPWTQNNFSDAMVSGYHMPVWRMDTADAAPLAGLVLEQVISTNTTAAGGNAHLMTLG